MLNVIRERACKVISLAFSKLYYAWWMIVGIVQCYSGKRNFVKKRQRYHLKLSLSFHDTRNIIISKRARAQ